MRRYASLWLALRARRPRSQGFTMERGRLARIKGLFYGRSDTDIVNDRSSSPIKKDFLCVLSALGG
jgi:hypothetical protein